MAEDVIEKVMEGEKFPKEEKQEIEAVPDNNIEEVVSQNEKERIIKYKKDYYIQRKIKAGYYYFLNYYFWITIAIFFIGFVLGIIFVLPKLDSSTEIFKALQTAWDYLKNTGGATA